VSEAVKAFPGLGLEAPVFFWPDRAGHEVDLIIDAGRRLIPVEVKSGATIPSNAFSGPSYWINLPDNSHRHGVLVYGGTTATHTRSGFPVRPWYECS
jgi:uncharacterized protein